MNALLAAAWLFPQSFVERLGWVLVHSLWQFAMLGLVTFLLLRWLRNGSSTARHRLLVCTLAVTVMAPVATWLVLPASLPQNHEPVANDERGANSIALDPTDFGNADRTVHASNEQPQLNSAEATRVIPAVAVPGSLRERISRALQPWLTWIVGAWCVGVGLGAVRPLIGWQMLRRLRTVGVSVPSIEVQTAFERVAERLGLRRAATVLYSTLATGPLVVGYFRPVVLLPISLVTSIPLSQLEAILAHELAHVRRHDFVINLLQTFIETLFFYHPAIWWLSRRIRIEREHCCDDLVVELFDNRAEYGRALIAVEQLPARTRALALGAADGSLLGRIRRIVGVTKDRQVQLIERWPSAIALAIAVAIAVPLAMLRAAEEKPGAPVQQHEPQQPIGGAQLNPGAEENLKWGEPAGGLRCAVVIRHSAERPKKDELPDLYIAVQNVSQAPIRLNDTLAEQQPRMLYLKIDGRTVAGIGAKDPRLGDVLLPPRAIAYVPMYSLEKMADGHTTGQVIAEGALKDTHQSLVAHLEIEKAPAGAWIGKLVTGDTTGVVAAGQPQPKDKHAQALLAVWQHHARGNGNFPGGLIGRLGEKVFEFIRNNTGDKSGDPYAKKMEPLVKRFDANHDWKAEDVVALMDDIAAVSSIPLETTLEELTKLTFTTGAPLPPELANAPWGEQQPSGLRMAWLLEPRVAEHRLGTALKSRILIHNAGKNTVVFRTRTWHQSGHTARDDKGAEIGVDSTHWLTLAPLMPYRLAPGEYVELTATGIGVGRNKNDEDWQGTRVGSWVEAKAGDEVTLTTSPVPLSDWNDPPGDSGWWLNFVNAHLTQDLPLPADADERKRLVYRAGMELFGTPLSAEEIAAFVSDRESTALDALATRLVKRPDITPFSGSLSSAPTKFRVVPADPDAAKKPRTANNPGRYTLGENIRLVVTRRPVGDRIVNEASIMFFSPNPNVDPPGKPVELQLPDGYNTWAAAWERDGTVMWLQEKGNLRSYDFTNPAAVKETTIEESSVHDRVPQPILDALHTALVVPGAPKPSPPPAAAAN